MTLKSLIPALASSLHSRLLYLTAYETYLQEGLKGFSNSEENHLFLYFLHVWYSSPAKNLAFS